MKISSIFVAFLENMNFTFFELPFKLSEDSMDQANVAEVLNNSKIVTAQWEWFLIFAEKNHLALRND